MHYQKQAFITIITILIAATASETQGVNQRHSQQSCGAQGLNVHLQLSLHPCQTF